MLQAIVATIAVFPATLVLYSIGKFKVGGTRAGGGDNHPSTGPRFAMRDGRFFALGTPADVMSETQLKALRHAGARCRRMLKWVLGC